MSSLDVFKHRVDAGRRLGEALSNSGLADPIVFGLPRGGVPVAFEVAIRLGAQLEVLVARKVGAPGRSEFGIGAIAEGGVRVADSATLRMLQISDVEFNQLANAEVAELDRRVAVYRGDRALPPAHGREVVVVDDGLATGVTAEAALLAARRLGQPLGDGLWQRRHDDPDESVLTVASQDLVHGLDRVVAPDLTGDGQALGGHPQLRLLQPTPCDRPVMAFCPRQAGFVVVDRHEEMERGFLLRRFRLSASTRAGLDRSRPLGGDRPVRGGTRAADDLSRGLWRWQTTMISARRYLAKLLADRPRARWVFGPCSDTLYEYRLKAQELRY